MIECYGICSENCTAWQNGKCVLDAKKAEAIYDFETKEESAEEEQYGQPTDYQIWSNERKQNGLDKRK